MTGVVEHLAELTGFRDRDRLDATLVVAFDDLLRPRGVAIHRVVGEGDEARWISRARLRAGERAPSADPPWSDFARLPRLAEHPLREAVLRSARMRLGEGPAPLAVFPLANDRAVVGVLEIETEVPLDEATQRLVLAVLRIYRNFEALLDYSERDTLTGLLNRKTFDESFLKLAGLPQPPSAAPADERRQEDVPASHWLGVIDIDHFKRVNDNFGHPIGDEVLLLLARLMRNSFRFGDQLYRFGGEEFVVLLRCTGESGAALAFERMRLATEGYEFPQVGHITVSVGFTEIDPDDTPSAAFERADKAVYHAKGHGRNQVCSHAALVAAGLLQSGNRTGGVEFF